MRSFLLTIILLLGLLVVPAAEQIPLTPVSILAHVQAANPKSPVVPYPGNNFFPQLNVLVNSIKAEGVDFFISVLPPGVVGSSDYDTIVLSQEVSDNTLLYVLLHERAHQLAPHYLDETTPDQHEVFAEAVAAIVTSRLDAFPLGNQYAIYIARYPKGLTVLSTYAKEIIAVADYLHNTIAGVTP